MAYVTYEWYSNTFKGKTIPDAEAFDGVIIEAEAYIDYITRKKITETTDEVKKVADYITDSCDRDGVKKVIDKIIRGTFYDKQ